MLRHLTARPAAPARVVVIGAQGFVGNAVARRLEARSVPVLRVARQQVDFLASDAAEKLAALLRPSDAVLMAAAIAPCKNGEMLRDNMIIAAAMTKAASRVQLDHFVNISSDAVYSDSPGPLTEASTMAPDSLHGIMHLAREAMFRSEIKAPVANLRPTLIYGAGDPHNGYGPNSFRRLAAKGEPVVLFGEGEERRDHVLIDDVADLVVRVLMHRSTGALNIATGKVASFRDIAQKVVQLSGMRSPIQTRPRTGPMPHNGYRPFDVAACRAAFPDFAYVGLDDGLAKARKDEAAGATA